MRKMFREMKNLMDKNEDMVLVNIVASSGSTPRGTGARMLISKDGLICGTIGGGAVEYRSEAIAREILENKASGEYNFTLTKDDIQNLGMICGGAVNVYFTFIRADDINTAALLIEAENRFNNLEDLWLISELSDGGKLGLYSEDGGIFGISAPNNLNEHISKKPQRFSEGERDFYIEQINFSGKVFIFGCGHVALELEPVLTHLGFKCIMLDDRKEFADKACFPTAEDVRLIDFENIGKTVEIGENDYAVIMTRGHAYDMRVQAQVMKTEACYIGVIGSRAKKEGVFNKLREEGFTDEDLNRITTPIGISIKAETPAEIAISIAAQLIDFRAKRNLE